MASNKGEMESNFDRSDRYYLFSTKEGIAELKEKVAEVLGADNSKALKFDRDAKAHYLDLPRLPGGEIDRNDQRRFQNFRGTKAQSRWKEDKTAQSLASHRQSETLNAAAANSANKQYTKVDTFDPSRFVYPATSQRGRGGEFEAVKSQTGATVRYLKDLRRFYIVEGPIEPFAAFQGKEAEARYAREYSKKGVDNANEEQALSNSAKEINALVKGQTFLPAYSKHGFMLSSKDPRRTEQLSELAAASNQEIAEVGTVTRQKIFTLRDREIGIRAKAANMSHAEMKALPFVEQRKVSNDAGLSQKDRGAFTALDAGYKQISSVLVDRGVWAQRNQSTGQSAGKQSQESKSEQNLQGNEAEAAAVLKHMAGQGNGQGM